MKSLAFVGLNKLNEYELCKAGSPIGQVRSARRSPRVAIDRTDALPVGEGVSTWFVVGPIAEIFSKWPGAAASRPVRISILANSLDAIAHVHFSSSSQIIAV